MEYNLKKRRRFIHHSK